MNISEVLVRQMQHRPEATAIVHASGKLSYGAFGSRVLRSACGLVEAGIQPGEVVGVRLDDPLDHWMATLALAHAGATVMSIPRSMPDIQRNRLLRLTRCQRLLDGDEYDSSQALEGLLALPWSQVKNHPCAMETAARAAPDQPWLFATGSGSTGRPKIMPMSHQVQVRRAALARSWLPYGPEDILLTLVGMHFFMAKQRSLEATEVGAAVFLDAPGRVDHREAVSRGEVTAIYATVSHIERLLRLLPAQDRPHYEQLRALMISGSTVSMRLRKQIRDRLTSKLYVLWGTNESNTSTITRLSDVFATEGGVGHPFPGVSIEIVDAQGCRLSPGAQGRFKITSPTIIDGYLGNPQATAKAFVDASFYPGDIGHFTPDGQLVHLGREDDMMIVSGINVYPAEIEECLRLHPGVADVLATPLRDEVLQDLPVALVVAEPGTNLDTRRLVNHVRDQIGRHALHDLVLVERIPRSDQGKTQRELVQQILASTWRLGRPLPNAGRKAEAQAERRALDVAVVRFQVPLGATAQALAPWHALLSNEDAPANRSLGSMQASELGRNWLEQVLLLARNCLHVLRVPVFESVEIISCRPRIGDIAKGHAWEGACRLPDNDLVSRGVMEGVLKFAFGLAAWACKADVGQSKDRVFFYQAIKKGVIQAYPQVKPRGKSTFAVLQAAHRLQIPYRPLAGDVFQLGWGSRARRIDRSTTDQDSAIGMRGTQNKLITAQWLRDAGLPAPTHRLVSSAAQAREFADRLTYPVVIKPADLERGEGVSVDVMREGLDAAFDHAHKLSRSKSVLVERQVPGVCHRLFIASGKLLYAVRRLPIGVYADGRSSIQALVEAECRAQQRLPPWNQTGIRPLDELALRSIAGQGWDAASVPQQGRFVALRRIETTAWGGIDEEVTDTLHSDNVRAAVAATELFGLEVAGVDMISPDIRQPWHANGAIINEVNYAPLLGGGEISRRHLGEYLRRVVEHDGRIPVHVYVGGARAWHAAQERWICLRAGGAAAYLTNNVRSLDGEGRDHAMSSNGVHERVRALLLCRTVQALVIVLQTSRSLRHKLPVDRVASFEVVDHELREEYSDAPSSTSQADIQKLVTACRAWFL